MNHSLLNSLYTINVYVHCWAPHEISFSPDNWLHWKKQDKEYNSNNILSSRIYFQLFLGQTNHEIIAKWYIVMSRITKNLQNQTIVRTSHMIFLSTWCYWGIYFLNLSIFQIYWAIFSNVFILCNIYSVLVLYKSPLIYLPLFYFTKSLFPQISITSKWKRLMNETIIQKI